MSVEVMLDLETMGREPGCAIVSIGAVKFDMTAMTIGETFYQNVHLADCVNQGLTIDPATVLWWMGQSDDARRALLYSAEPLAHALTKFTEWLGSDDLCVWGNGPSFDNAILSAAYRAVGQKQPWKFWRDRCFRTICAMYPSVEREAVKGIHHNARDDAIAQAEHILKIRRTISARRSV